MFNARLEMISFLQPNQFDIKEWLSGHSSAITKPIIDTVMEALKKEGVTKFAFTGYCYGGMESSGTSLR